MINKNHMYTTQKMIFNLKQLYDVEGMAGCNQLFRSILDHPMGTKKERLRLVVELIRILFKIDACQNGCFDNLDTKESCSCMCNEDPVTIPFKDLDTFKQIGDL